MPMKLQTEQEIENPPAPMPPEVDPNPPQPPSAPPPETPEEKAHRLEIENAELRGRQSVFEKKPEPIKTAPVETKSAQETQWETTKSTVNSHLSALDDEKFEEQYKMSKADARAQVAQGDQKMQAIKTNERTARMEAENRLYRKYQDYGEFENEVRESIADAAPEIRQDPERLSRYLERHYKAASATKPKPPAAPKTPEGNPMNRRIVNQDFVPPNPSANPTNQKNLQSRKPGEIAPENAKYCKAFGVETEEERQSFMKPEIEMNMGGGIVLRDPAKGFEKIKP